MEGDRQAKKVKMGVGGAQKWLAKKYFFQTSQKRGQWLIMRE